MKKLFEPIIVLIIGLAFLLIGIHFSKIINFPETKADAVVIDFCKYKSGRYSAPEQGKRYKVTYTVNNKKYVNETTCIGDYVANIETVEFKGIDPYKPNNKKNVVDKIGATTITIKYNPDNPNDIIADDSMAFALRGASFILAAVFIFFGVVILALNIIYNIIYNKHGVDEANLFEEKFQHILSMSIIIFLLLAGAICIILILLCIWTGIAKLIS